MTTPPAVISVQPSPDWGDAWSHPEYFSAITVKRMIAYLLDILIVAILAVPVWFIGMLLTALSFGFLAPLHALALALLPLAYHITLLSGPRSATFGMRVMGVRMMSLSQESVTGGGRPTVFQAIIQIIAFYGSMALTGGLVLLVALFNSRRRTLHDWLAGTVVVNDLHLGLSHDVG